MIYKGCYYTFCGFSTMNNTLPVETGRRHDILVVSSNTVNPTIS
jgi:hypothetical protein